MKHHLQAPISVFSLFFFNLVFLFFILPVVFFINLFSFRVLLKLWFKSSQILEYETLMFIYSFLTLNKLAFSVQANQSSVNSWPLGYHTLNLFMQYFQYTLSHTCRMSFLLVNWTVGIINIKHPMWVKFSGGSDTECICTSSITVAEQHRITYTINNYMY